MIVVTKQQLAHLFLASAVFTVPMFPHLVPEGLARKHELVSGTVCCFIEADLEESVSMPLTIVVVYSLETGLLDNPINY